MPTDPYKVSPGVFFIALVGGLFWAGIAVGFMYIAAQLLAATPK